MFKPPLERMRKVRAANNILWMELVEIALNEVPERGIRILKDIISNDDKIRENMKEMIQAHELCSLDSNQDGIEKTSKQEH